MSDDESFFSLDEFVHSDDELFDGRRWDLLLVRVLSRIGRLLKRIKELEKRMTDLENRVTKAGG